MNIRILVLPLGNYQWIYVGDFSRDGMIITLKRAVNVRNYSEGIGSVVDGDTSNMTLDKAGDAQACVGPGVFWLTPSEKGLKMWEGLINDNP